MIVEHPRPLRQNRLAMLCRSHIGTRIFIFVMVTLLLQQVWDLSTQDSWSSIACKVTMIGHRDTVRCLQVDDDKVISGSYDMMLKIWDLRTGQCRKTLA